MENEQSDAHSYDERFHLAPLETHHLLPPPAPVARAQRRGWKARLDALKSLAIVKVDSARTSATLRMIEAKAHSKMAMEKLKSESKVAAANARSNSLEAMADMESSMRANPTKWTAIAASTGLAVGLLGRYLQHRAKQRSRMPRLVVIERACR